MKHDFNKFAASLNMSEAAGAAGERIDPKAHSLTEKRCQMKKRIVLAGIFLFSWVFGVRAQGTTGTISGTVKDQQGAAVAGASVRIVNDETSESRVIPADSDARYWAPLPPGNYRISIDQQGFEGVEESVALANPGIEGVRELTVATGRQRGVWPHLRGRCFGYHPLRQQSIPRFGLRLPLQQRAQRTEFL